MTRILLFFLSLGYVGVLTVEVFYKSKNQRIESSLYQITYKPIE